MTEKELSIVIPAYNEEEALRANLPEMLAFCEAKNFQLIITNDGSKDKTGEILLQHSSNPYLTVVRHKLNKGYGGAIKSGVIAAETKYVITIDADGQHYLEDVEKLFIKIKETDADMIVGGRKIHNENWYRKTGKSLIRSIAKFLMPINIHDINSGMKIYNTQLGKKYLKLCPDSMAYSDIIALVFISQRHLVLEESISIKPRTSGESTINTRTAFDTIMEILNVVILFNPMRVFLPIAIFLLTFGTVWELPFLLRGMGVSVGAMLLLVSGLLFFFLGLLAEQLSLIRKNSIR